MDTKEEAVYKRFKVRKYIFKKDHAGRQCIRNCLQDLRVVNVLLPVSNLQEL